jgi:hypothetical protein
MRGSIPGQRRARGAQASVRLLSPQEVHDLIVAINLGPSDDDGDCCSICKALGQEVLSDGSIVRTRP